jgi:hypothetical protein
VSVTSQGSDSSGTSATSDRTLVENEGSMPVSAGLTEAEVHALTGSRFAGLVGAEDSMAAQVSGDESGSETD